MYSAFDISKFVINLFNKENVQITNLKLQKMLYLLQCDYYNKTHERLIEEDFYAWKLGPVIPEVYEHYSVYASTSLPQQENVSLECEKTIVDILSQYIECSAWDLVKLTQSDDPYKYNFKIFGDKSKIAFVSIANSHK